MKKKNLSVLIKILLILAIFLSGAGGYFYFQKAKSASQEQKKDAYSSFLFEVYETIQENYWDKVSDEELTDLFFKAIGKLRENPQELESKNKKNLEKLFTKLIQEMPSEEEKKDFTAKLADIVLANLKPFGRSRLYTEKEKKALSNRVKNINPEINQYEVLAVEKDATQKEIERAYQEKEKTPEVQQAYRVLSDSDNRKTYDEKGVEPTMDYELIRPAIFYIHLKKFSPTSLEELKLITEKVDQAELGGPDTLIFDLRDNVGGSVDLLPYFLGPFIGNNQYAYQFFHQEEKADFKTKIGWLPSLIRYKKVVILINENTQSSAEIAAAVLKKYNVGVVLGTKTRGWGTIEQVFPIKQQISADEKHSIFLVHSLTLRDDGQPIEGRGVEPVIDINSADWEEQLYGYFNYPELGKTIREIIRK